MLEGRCNFEQAQYVDCAYPQAGYWRTLSIVKSSCPRRTSLRRNEMIFCDYLQASSVGNVSRSLSASHLLMMSLFITSISKWKVQSSLILDVKKAKTSALHPGARPISTSSSTVSQLLNGPLYCVFHQPILAAQAHSMNKKACCDRAPEFWLPLTISSTRSMYSLPWSALTRDRMHTTACKFAICEPHCIPFWHSKHVLNPSGIDTYICFFLSIIVVFSNLPEASSMSLRSSNNGRSMHVKPCRAVTPSVYSTIWIVLRSWSFFIRSIAILICFLATIVSPARASAIPVTTKLKTVDIRAQLLLFTIISRTCR